MVKKKVAIIGTAGLPPSYGGFETLAANLVSSDRYDYTVYCEPPAKGSKQATYRHARLHYWPLKANGSQSIFYDIVSIFHAWWHADVLLILGTAGCVVLPFKVFFRSKKVLVNFGGLEWKRDKWGRLARWYLKLSEKFGVNLSDEVVSDNQAFVNYVQQTYKRKATLIEYGGDHARKVPVSEDFLAQYPFLAEPYFVSVSRAQEDNNLHLLCAAFAATPHRTLVLVSNWDVQEYGRKLRQQYGHLPNLRLIGPIYQQDHIDVIRSNAYAYIHSHKYCGTAPSLVEAMNLGLPVISFRNDTNGFTTEEKAVFFSTAEDLMEQLNLLDTPRLQQVATDMKEIANRRYSWQTIIRKYESCYV